MTKVEPGLFGIKRSNRDFKEADAWGKNQFNNAFPAALCCFLDDQDIKPVYLKLNSNNSLEHDLIEVSELYGASPKSEDIFYAFEANYTPFQKLVIGSLPRVDLVTQDIKNETCIKAVEIKLTALPDNSTCNLGDDKYSCEIVVRPDTIVYLACSIAQLFKKNVSDIMKFIPAEIHEIDDWTEPENVIPYIKTMVVSIDNLMLEKLDVQEPIVMQPIWKTNGKRAILSDNAFDVFVWSNFAFVKLFLDVADKEFDEKTRITRQIRTVIWLFKMLYDYGTSENNQFNHRQIIDTMGYNTRNDKAFAVSGIVTHRYLSHEHLVKPRISKYDLRNIILGGGQNYLSPERRLDAIIVNSPELFEDQQ